MRLGKIKNVVLYAITTVAILAMAAFPFMSDMYPYKALFAFMLGFIWVMVFLAANGILEAE